MSEIVSVFNNFSINQVVANVFDEPDKLADFAAAVSTGEVTEVQSKKLNSTVTGFNESS
jgi:hypothetical protein